MKKITNIYKTILVILNKNENSFLFGQILYIFPGAILHKCLKNEWNGGKRRDLAPLSKGAVEWASANETGGFLSPTVYNNILSYSLQYPPISLLRKETGKSMIPPRLFSDQKRRGGAVEKGPGGTPGFSPGTPFWSSFPVCSANRFSGPTENRAYILAVS